MKITVTGSLGHISKPLAEELIRQGHTVTVISSRPGREKDIEAIGAIAAIGSVEDAGFLTGAFTGADAVYCMEPPAHSFFDHNFDIMAYHDRVVNNFLQAIQQSGVKRVVHLSSVGGHTDKGNGMLRFHFGAENILGTLPQDIAITTLRPVGFYYNLFAFIPAIKTSGVMASNYSADYKEPWVSPVDIAAVAAEEIVQSFEGRKVRYIASDELTTDELAAILGEAIGQPDLKWVALSDEQSLNGMIAAGMNPVIAKGLNEMNAGRRDGLLYEDYFRHKPVPGKVKMTEFAKEFAAAFHQK